MSAPRPRICYVLSSEMTVAAFLKDHIRAATSIYDVSVVANTEDADFLRKIGLDATLYPIAIVRPISPGRDLQALRALARLFRTEHFDIVHSVSPKAGLLAMLAGRLAGVRHCVHTFTGQVWATRHGWQRWLLKQADCCLAALTTHTLVDSPSQRDFLIEEGVLRADKAEVIGKGSICGVDGERFRPDPDIRGVVRAELGVPPQAVVLLFLGRLNRDKGVVDLAMAFYALANRFPDLRLLLVGPDEASMVARIESICAGVAKRILRIDYTRVPERFMAAADIFCLPSYREGFGMVVIEAAAAGLPAVASRIYGITDAVVEGETGLLHPPGDVEALVAALAFLIGDAKRRADMGRSARARALADFSQAESSRGLLAFYGRILG